MKKEVILFGMLLFSLTFISASLCAPEVTLINQDPYPAIPGEYVKVVFQISNIESRECQSMTFELLEKYPIVFDPNTNPVTTINTGFYERDFNSFLIAPYKVRIDELALEGNNPIETRIKQGTTGDLYISRQFDLYVEDSRAEFEIHINDYSYTTKELTIEILNIADVDVEALTIEIPKQENIEISGTNRIVVGDLDSNEYTTADFTAVPKDGEIQIKILYTDQTGSRRELSETLVFDSYYFSDSQESQKQISISYYIFGFVILVLIIWWGVRRRKKKNDRARRRGHARL